MRTILFLTLLLLWLALIMPLSAFGKRRKLPPVVAKFGGECHSTAFRHSAQLQQLIKTAWEREVSPSNSPGYDGAFAYDLNGDGSSEYFVRLGCGATGNCTWGILSDRPARIRGTFIAWFFYIHRRSGSWSQLSTYTREGGDRGVIATLANRRGKYIQTTARTEQGDYRDPQPFLTRMGIPKCEVSGTARYDESLGLSVR